MAGFLLEVKRYLRVLFIFLVLILSACRPAVQPELDEPINILFIGNSYTFMNNLPEIFADVSEFGGHNVNVTTHAKPGFSLIDHAVDPKTRAVIQEENWDYVVLQEKSSIPVLDEKLMVQGVSQIIELAAGQDVNMILFMPWAYQAGLPEAGMADYRAMQSKVAETYQGVANEFDLELAPVGLAWQSALGRRPELNLWNPDGSHPSELGSYLAANIFYALIFQESPAGLLDPEESDADLELNRLLQEIAAETVLEKPGN
jgi:hypothetical protein